MSEITTHGDGPAGRRGTTAETALGDAFAAAGWSVGRAAARSPAAPDLMVRRGTTAYGVQLKYASEGRSDRLVPLWAQAHLQALRWAGGGVKPLAVVAAPRISRRTAEQVLAFAAEHAPHAAAGVIDLNGFRLFRGARLETLNTPEASARVRRRTVAGAHANLFSDLNQWMLKVLLAPELPESLLAAPRGKYRNATALARAADVSVMSASRFVRQLQHDGFLHESAAYLELVRREELFRRWQQAAGRRIREAPFRFLLRSPSDRELVKVLDETQGCLGLFAAADALGVGFVRGVPPHLYVRRLEPGASPSKFLVHAEPNEPPDVIVRDAAFPNSIFRGAIQPAALRVTDIIQVWLDSAGHPARGQEQAEVIRGKVLAPLIEGRGVPG
jgi:hypothetical protein